MTGPGFGQTSLFPPEPAPDPLLCWLWLANTLGAGSSHAGRVLDVFGGAQEAWENRDSDAFRKAVGSPAFARANLPDNTPAHYRAFARRCAARNIRILPYDDPDYPLAFSRIPDMPLVLYCTGDPLWLNEPGAVGMVGSRRPTEYGLQAAADLGSGLAKNGAIIVSGLADGLDSAGHRAAVKENCPTIGVLGVPIDRTYPASNRELRKKIEQKGCVISEYPPESGPVGPNGFLQRNRLIAALSSALVVVEAQERAAPCPQSTMPSGMASRCSWCRAASTRPTQQAPTPCYGRAGPKPSANPATCSGCWACGARRLRQRCALRLTP